MSTTTTIDWLSVTFKDFGREQEQFIHLLANNDEGIPARASFGYTECTKYSNGLLHMWNPVREEMGHHAQLSGSVLRHIFEQGLFTAQTLLRQATDIGARVTRLDLAKDCFQTDAKVREIYETAEHEGYTGSVHSLSVTKNTQGGITLYAGVRQSEKLLRIYDKANLEGLSNETWVRLELETKSDTARALCRVLLENNNWLAVFDTISRTMLEVPKSPSWQALYLDKVAEIGLPKIERKSDTEAWIGGQVCQSVLRWLQEHPESDAVWELHMSLALWYDMHPLRQKLYNIDKT